MHPGDDSDDDDDDDDDDGDKKLFLVSPKTQDISLLYDNTIGGVVFEQRGNTPSEDVSSNTSWGGGVCVCVYIYIYIYI